MGYPATTHYLTMKLNWMARKLKGINEPSNIKDWTEEMHSIYRVLEEFTRNEALSTPPKMNRAKWEIHKAPCINTTASDIKAKDTKSKMGTIQRPVVKGVRSTRMKIPSSSMESKKFIGKGKVSEEHTVCHESTTKYVSMEVEEDVTEWEDWNPKWNRRQREICNIEDKVAKRKTSGNGEVSNI